MTVEQLRKRLDLDPVQMGFVFQPVREQGLAASRGATAFEELFLGFSVFIIASAAMLVALLFGLGIVRRASEIGLLLAIGFRQRQVRRMLVLEGLLVAAVGSLFGVLGGIAYAWLMLAGLQSWWLEAVVTPFLHLEITSRSLLIGYATGLGIAVAVIWWTARWIGRVAPRRLMAGDISQESRALIEAGRIVRPRCAVFASWSLLAAAVLLGLLAIRLDAEAQALAFFGAGSLVLTAAMLLLRSRLISARPGAAVAAGRGNLLRLAVRNAARHPGRSTLTIGLVAVAAFLIAAVSAFRIDPAAQGSSIQSGSGGFSLAAQSDQPIYADWNTKEGEANLGFSDEDSAIVSHTTTVAFRMMAGDDASCLKPLPSGLAAGARSTPIAVKPRWFLLGGFCRLRPCRA